MSMRTAIMEMYGAKKVKREAWVPESILDDDVSHFMGAAAAAKKAGKSHFDFGGKKYKVTMKSDAAKKIDEESCPECGADGECQCEQPVQEAADMDPKDHVKYNDEMEMYCVYNKDGKVVAKFKDEEDANNYAMKNHDDLMEVSYKTAMKSYQKAMGQSKDADTAGDKKTGDKKFDQAVKFGRYATKKFKSSKNKKKLVSTTRKEETVEEAVSVKKKDYSWGRMMTVNHGTSHSYPLHPEHQAAIKKLGDNQKTSFKDETGTKVTAHRKGDTVHLSSSQTSKKTPVPHSHFTESVNEAAGTAQHRPTPETSDTYNKQMNNGEGGIPMGKKKDFVNQHNMEVAYDAEELYKQNKYEALSKTPARPGDKSDGDKNVVNPIPTNMVDGMKAALAKMKNSGE